MKLSTTFGILLLIFEFEGSSPNWAMVFEISNASCFGSLSGQHSWQYGDSKTEEIGEIDPGNSDFILMASLLLSLFSFVWLRI